MLYETLSQPLAFICIFLVGIFCGFLFDLANLLNIFFNRNKVCLQIFCVIFSAFLVFFVNLKINYGKARFFVAIAFVLAFWLERQTVGRLWSKFLNFCGNKWHAYKTKMKDKTSN